jgi:hypothetical protein
MKKVMATSCHHLLRCNDTTKEDDDTLPSSFSSLQHHHRRKQRHIVIIFFFSNIKRTKHTRKQQKKTKKKEGAYLQAFALPFHFWFMLLPSCFCTSISVLFWHPIFFKHNKRKKNHREEKKCEEGKELTFKLPFCPFTFGSRFCLPPFALPF